MNFYTSVRLQVASSVTVTYSLFVISSSIVASRVSWWFALHIVNSSLKSLRREIFQSFAFEKFFINLNWCKACGSRCEIEALIVAIVMGHNVHIQRHFGLFVRTMSVQCPPNVHPQFGLHTFSPAACDGQFMAATGSAKLKSQHKTRRSFKFWWKCWRNFKVINRLCWPFFSINFVWTFKIWISKFEFQTCNSKRELRFKNDFLDLGSEFGIHRKFSTKMQAIQWKFAKPFAISCHTVYTVQGHTVYSARWAQ